MCDGIFLLTVNAVQTSRDRASRCGVHRPARPRGVHLPRRGERPPAQLILIPENR